MSRLTPAVRAGLGITLAVSLYGISFGALATASGLSVLQALVLSAVMFTGGSQFAFVGAMAGGGPTALGAAALLGLRNAVYGAEMNALLRFPAKLRPLAAHVTIDESTATALGQDTPAEQRRGFWTAGLGIWVGWTTMTLVGALLGEALDPKRWGLDGAAVAAFMGLLWPRLRQRQAVAIAIASAVVTLLLVPVLPVGVPLLVAAAVAGVVSWVRPGRVSAKPAGLSDEQEVSS
ncbi:AzlC family ABC transporter permease [Aestuariimicrobium soli]|uniref:AzlC family ABC transporter permease n=1 Tax=Aestuariimicrobium soli TaxID=2035834 RepID=UPI003EBA5054